MAEWITKRLRLRKVAGFLKDQLAVGCAIAKSRFTVLRIAVIRATSHEDALPDEKYVKIIFGSGSRMHASYCISILMNRLNKIRSWIVAIKCLIILHRGLQDGNFMFQDQVSYFPSTGGHNYLNLSSFRDRSTAFTWQVSLWIRWYANFLDQWLLTCRILGIFLDSNSSRSDISAQNVSSLPTQELIKEIITLQDFLEEACAVPANVSLIENVLVEEAFRMVLIDTVNAGEELRIRMGEALLRLTNLQRSEAVQLLKVCEKLGEQSSKLLQLMEIGRQLNITACTPTVIFNDYEIMRMREALGVVCVQSTSMHIRDRRRRISLSRRTSFRNKTP